MIQGKFLYGNENLSEVLQIRNKVFGGENGGLMEDDQESLDAESIHVLVFEKQKNVATGRLWCNDQSFEISLVAVLAEERGKYFGDFVVRMLVDKAFLLGAMEITIRVENSQICFFEKIGFCRNGDPYNENGIIYFPMVIRKHQLCKGCQS